MVHYESVKIIINAPGIAKVIINVVMHSHEVSESILMDRGLLFTSKFWALLCYFFGIKRKLSTAFHTLTDNQTERQNSTMEVYLRVFVNW